MALIKKLTAIKEATDTLSATVESVRQKKDDADEKPLSIGVVGNMLKALDYDAMIMGIDVAQKKMGLHADPLIALLSQLKGVTSMEQLQGVLKGVKLTRCSRWRSNWPRWCPACPWW
ncbi:MAG: hypothetical protein MJZ81_01520 [Bacteroidales bacterium]|nr:hypothetical protein [Bacteroidales bacterium]